MAEILHANYKPSALEGLYRQKLNKGDLLGALLLITTMKNHGVGEVELCLKRAKIFYEMERYESACEEWFKYLTFKTDKNSQARAFNALGACFYRLGDTDTAGTYFEKQLRLNNKANYEYCNVTLEYYEEVLNRKNYYRLAYPFDKADFSKILTKCDDLIRIKEYDRCIESVSMIPENSPFYVDRLVTESVCYFLSGKDEKATEIIEKAYEIDPSSTLVLCNAISIFSALKNEEKANFYFDKINFETLTDSDNIYKILMVCAERKNNVLVKDLSIKYLKEKPYSASALSFLGIACYNLKEYVQSEDAFKKAFQISSSPIHFYYYQISEKATKQKLEYTRLDYRFDVPNKIRKAFLKRATQLLKLTPEERTAFEEDVHTLSHYALNSIHYDLQSSAVTLLGDLQTPLANKTLMETLLKLGVYDKVKLGTVGYLASNGYSGNLNVVITGKFLTLTLENPTFGEVNKNVFQEAYSYAIVKSLPNETNFVPLKESAEKIYKVFESKGILESVTDVPSLSATILEISDTVKIASRRGFAKYFGANLRTIKYIKSQLEE